MTGVKKNIVWFRQDLRLADNPALIHAASSGDVIPVYILDDVNAGRWALGAASRVWLHYSLISLNQALNNQLLLFVGDASKILPRLVRQLDIDKVCWNRCYEPWRIQRDKAMKSRLTEQGTEVFTANASLLREPWTTLKKDGTPYQVFTPFYKNNYLNAAPPELPASTPDTIRYAVVDTDEISGVCGIEELQLLPPYSWYQQMISADQIGEAAAAQKLEQFYQSSVDNYQQARDFPALNATSNLSAHLHFGEISPRQIWASASQLEFQRKTADAADFLRELVWREFSYYLLFHWPDFPERPFKQKFAAFPWATSNDFFIEAWQQGQTGFPLIDAGMRELWQTGYMHNRVRMVVASFLVKNMLVDWQVGQAWFWDCLFDADLANNSASWQWVAGSGVDAAPYFRIFNPVRQSERFDPEGAYIKRWCPELEKLPPKYLHNPSTASSLILANANIQLGRSYPEPILDLKTTRAAALALYQSISVD